MPITLYGHAYVTILDQLQWHRVHAWVVGSCSGLAVYIVFICMHCIGINEIDTWVLWGYPLNLNKFAIIVGVVTEIHAGTLPSLIACEVKDSWIGRSCGSLVPSGKWMRIHCPHPISQHNFIYICTQFIYTTFNGVSKCYVSWCNL